MPKINSVRHLLQRSSGWYYVRGIPKDLREILGKSQWSIPLHARTKTEAASKIRAIASQHDAMIERIRSHGAERVEDAVAFVEGLSMMAPTLVGASTSYVEAVSNEAEKEKFGSAAYRKRLLRHVSDAADSQYTPAKIAIREYKRAEAIFGLGQIEENDALDAGVQLVREIHGQSPRLSNTTNDGGLWPAFEEWKRIKSPVGDTISEAEASVRRFIELIGDKLLLDINKNDVRAYRSALLDFPLHLPKEIIRQTLPEILQTAEGKGWQSISPTSVRKRLGLLRAILSVAVDAGAVDDNPFAGVRVQDAGRGTRLPFTPEDFKAIFETPPLDGSFPMTETGWLILALIHTGARLGEIVQLTVDDLKKDGDVLYLSILDDESGAKRLKNLGSRRALPIHSNLIALGFDSFVRSKGEGRVFDIAPDVRGRISGLATKRIQKWIRGGAGILDTGKAPAHSFRHAFRDIALGSGLQEVQVDQLLGHAPVSVGRRYGVGYGIGELANAVRRIKFPFNIDHLVSANVSVSTSIS